MKSLFNIQSKIYQIQRVINIQQQNYFWRKQEQKLVKEQQQQNLNQQEQKQSVQNNQDIIIEVPQDANQQVKVDFENINLDNMTIKREKYYKKDGAQLYISKLLYLNRDKRVDVHKLWDFYQKDIEANQNNLFNSKCFMKKVLTTMKRKEKISVIGYDRKKKQFLGFKLNQEKAFEYTHPEILLSLSPVPDVKVLRRIVNKQEKQIAAQVEQ